MRSVVLGKTAALGLKMAVLVRPAPPVAKKA